MILAADFFRYLFSVGGVLVVLLMAAIGVWAASRSSPSPSLRRARTVMLCSSLAFSVISIYALEAVVARVIVGTFKPFRAGDAVAGRRTAIVVLGTGSVTVEDWHGRSYSLVDRGAMVRVLEAARVFALIDPAIVVASGGDPHPDPHHVPTGETMRSALIALGIPADRIMIETASKTTRDEAVVVAPLLRAQGVEQVILVTGETHMRRSVGAFRGAGVPVVPAIARELPIDELTWAELMMPSNEGLWLGATNIHELLGLAYYWLRRWA